ncbi:hypothetical protein GOODEAATRI_033735 [Goodea atripinnis]|uniref:Uncharacterized protein n=1 Tax=Goodea atripinnis TaxID=208336 RepID=A0ABV0Q3N8_9TELE
MSEAWIRPTLTQTKASFRSVPARFRIHRRFPASYAADGSVRSGLLSHRPTYESDNPLTFICPPRSPQNIRVWVPRNSKEKNRTISTTACFRTSVTNRTYLPSWRCGSDASRLAVKEEEDPRRITPSSSVRSLLILQQIRPAPSDPDPSA